MPAIAGLNNVRIHPVARMARSCRTVHCERQEKGAGIAGAFFATAMTVRTAGS
jgi:hypothetical protein